MAASVGIGFVLGLIVSRVIKHVRSSRELSMVVLAHVLLMVGVTYYLGFSVLLAGLTMGASAVNLTHEVRDRNRAFAALGAIEFPVVAIFFLWAGASLHIRALAGVGLLFVVYVVARTVGKLAGPLGLSWKARRADAESRSLVALGMSLLPQAGAAVGLGILARDALPTSGQPILAAVLGAVVIFELVGPVGVRWAANYAGEAQNPGDADPLTLEEALGRLRDRTAKILVVSGTSVSPTVLDAPQILAAKLRADLIVMSVRDERAARILAGRMASVLPGRYRRASDADRTEDRRGAKPFPLGERNLDRFFDRVAEHHPDAFFMALSPRSRALLGPAEALAERVHCPVFELPTGRTQGWAEALRGEAEGVDKVVRGWMSIYRTQAKNAPFLRHFAQAIESRKSLVRMSNDD